jgi:nucleoside-diphosphate-sugar epimerase
MSALSGSRVLVTGAAGRIGRVATAHLAGLGAAVTAMSLDGAAVDGADRVVAGDARSPEDVALALEGADAVVHLAALAHRDIAPAFDVYSTNVVSTFAVLTQAAERGVRRAVVAGSINRYGLPQGVDRERLPAYFPLDTDIPADVSDWYSLSKLNDENTSRMVWRRWGMDVVTLRLPHTNTRAELERVSAECTVDPRPTLTEGWSYLDVRDAAVAIERGLTADVRGAPAFYLAAPTTIVPYRTDDLLDRYAPGVLRTRAFAGREVPIDLTSAERLIGFRAQHELDLPTLDLPDLPDLRSTP